LISGRLNLRANAFLPVAVSVIEMTGPAGGCADAWSKNHATPQPRVPAQSGAANNRRRGDDDR
jgi:hypothetical protein